MDKLKGMQSLGRVSAGFSLVMSLPMLFYTIYSWIMWDQLRKNEVICLGGFKDNGEAVDVRKKWVVMAGYCAISSLVVFALQFIVAIAICIKPMGNTLANGINQISGLASCAWCANCFIIPLTIWAGWSDGCTGRGTEIDGSYAAQYRGFRLIWILMLAVSGGLCILICVMMTCCAGILAAKAADM